MVARASGAAPPILGGVDGAGAGCCLVESANVLNSDVSAEQVIEVHIDLGGSVDGDVDVFITDHVAGDDGSDDRTATVAAVDVDADAAGSGGVGLISKIALNVVVDDLIAAHVIRGKAERGTDMGVQGDATEPIVLELVVDDDVAGHVALAHAIGEQTGT